MADLYLFSIIELIKVNKTGNYKDVYSLGQKMGFKKSELKTLIKENKQQH